MKTFAILVATAIFAASIGTMKADASPLSDCYDDAIAACGFLWQAVDSGLDLCDGAHKSVGGGKIKNFTATAPKAKLKFRRN